MSRPSSRIRRHVPDALVLGLLALAQIDVLVGDYAGPPVALHLFPLGWTLPLLLRRRYPAFASLAVMVSLAIESQVAQEATESIIVLPALIAAFWTAGGIRDQARAVAVGITGGVLTAAVVAGNPGPVGGADIVFTAVVSIAPFLGGMAVAARDRRAEDLEESRDQAVADERARIARELHDVVGHAISVMTVQAGAARLLLDTRPRDARQALLAAEGAGRQAIAEMHRMLEVLRQEDGDAALQPQPRLADLERLLERVRESGLPVDLVVDGEPPVMSPGVELAAYRIVQEALTNVIKHARGARARVRLGYLGDAIELEIENDGRGADANGHGAGHGLVGMRERATLYGGELEAAPQTDGGFAVRARLPLGPGAGS